jgi:hypothetical protein
MRRVVLFRARVGVRTLATRAAPLRAAVAIREPPLAPGSREAPTPVAFLPSFFARDARATFEDTALPSALLRRGFTIAYVDPPAPREADVAAAAAAAAGGRALTPEEAEALLDPVLRAIRDACLGRLGAPPLVIAPDGSGALLGK